MRISSLGRRSTVRFEAQTPAKCKPLQAFHLSDVCNDILVRRAHDVSSIGEAAEGHSLF